jgi:hypothetical protein
MIVLRKFSDHLQSFLDNHSFDYLLLVTCSVFFLMALRLNRGDRSLTFMFVTGFALFYCLWALMHHGKNKTLNLKTMLEYVLISLTVIAFITLFIFS